MSFPIFFEINYMKTKSVQCEVATFEQCAEWAAEICEKVNLESYYTFSLEDNFEYGGLTIEGSYHILLDNFFCSKDRFIYVYLHEIAHIVSFFAGTVRAPDSQVHNKYFATILAIMYRRAGILSSISLYDFSDTIFRTNGALPTYMTKAFFDSLDNEGHPSNSDLIERFGYVIETSSRLADSNLTVEAAARQLATSDFAADWQTTVLPSRSTASIGPFRRLLAFLQA